MNFAFLKRWLILFLSLAVIVAARLWNYEQIVVDGQIYFIDADCYSRMTRVAEIVAHPGTILRHHDFENWPTGTTPHTTAPLDYLIASLAWITGNIDLAGAWISIGLAVLSGVVLWWWVRRFRWITQIAILLLFAVSPILVHGTVFGRPDHQSLLIFLVIVAFVTEWELQKNPSQLQSILNGIAWGFALWTSLFEPAILLVASVTLGIATQRKQWFNRHRAIAAISLSLASLFALGIEHWHVGSLPTGPLFERWSKSIGELAHVGWVSGTYLGWFGLVVIALPFVFAWEIVKKKNGVAVYWGGLFLLTFVLCTTAARWGYFLGIAVLFSIPFLLETWRAPWIAALFFLGFWPIAAEWDLRLWPTSEERDRLAEQREDYRELRQICQSIDGGGVVAPWWLSPSIAYWSRGKCVAGSSHQSLPGNADVAQFFLSRLPAKSREIVQRRNVRWVIAYEPSRVLFTSSALLEIPAVNDAFAITLYDQPRRAPSWLQLERETQFFRLYRVADE